MSVSEIKLPTNRKFGFFFSFIFFLIFIFLFFKGSDHYSYIFLLLTIIFIIITLLKANVLHSLNKAWMMFGMLLGNIVNPIVLGVIFFFIFTPVSLITRFFGRDELNIKLEQKTSNWQKNDIKFDFKKMF